MQSFHFSSFSNHFQSFSTIFHHFQSLHFQLFSIIFNYLHFQLFSIIFHHFQPFSINPLLIIQSFSIIPFSIIQSFNQSLIHCLVMIYCWLLELLQKRVPRECLPRLDRWMPGTSHLHSYRHSYTISAYMHTSRIANMYRCLHTYLHFCTSALQHAGVQTCLCTGSHSCLHASIHL